MIKSTLPVLMAQYEVRTLAEVARHTGGPPSAVHQKGKRGTSSQLHS